jgi:hypothetical protein
LVEEFPPCAGGSSDHYPIRARLRGIRSYLPRYFRGLVCRIYQRQVRGAVSGYRLPEALLYIHPLGSFDLGRSELYPHFLHLVAFHGLWALHRLHIFTLKSLRSATSNFAICSPFSPYFFEYNG